MYVNTSIHQYGHRVVENMCSVRRDIDISEINIYLIFTAFHQNRADGGLSNITAIHVIKMFKMDTQLNNMMGSWKHGSIILYHTSSISYINRSSPTALTYCVHWRIQLTFFFLGGGRDESANWSTRAPPALQIFHHRPGEECLIPPPPSNSASIGRGEKRKNVRNK